MFRTLINAFKNKEIRTKILITLALLFLYRIGCWLPVPGIDKAVFTATESNNLLGLLSAITGSALSNGAILALGISPYINASIIVQLLGAAIPALERYSKQGEEGRKKLNTITQIRYARACSYTGYRHHRYVEQRRRSVRHHVFRHDIRK